MERRAQLSRYATRNRPRRGWYYYVGAITGLAGFGGLMALGGFIVLRLAGERIPTDALVLQMLLSILGVLIFVLAQTQVREAEAPFLNKNYMDFETSRTIQNAISTLLSGPPPVTDLSTSGARVYQRLRLSEIDRRSRLLAGTSVQDWLDQRLDVGGFGVGLQSAGTGSRLGRIRDVAQSRIQLAGLSGDGQGSALSDGLVLVLEQALPHDATEKIRVVIPSESAIRSYLGRFVTELGKLFGEDSYRDEVLSGGAPLLQRFVVDDVSYVSDRLDAILRLPAESRPTVTVIGVEVAGHTIVGGAIQFGDEKTLYQLFPIGLVHKITDIVLFASYHSSP